MKIGDKIMLDVRPFTNPNLKVVHKGVIVALREDFGGEHAQVLWENDQEARDLWINTRFLVDQADGTAQNADHAQTEAGDRPTA